MLNGFSELYSTNQVLLLIFIIDVVAEKLNYIESLRLRVYTKYQIDLYLVNFSNWNLNQVIK